MVACGEGKGWPSEEVRLDSILGNGTRRRGQELRLFVGDDTRIEHHVVLLKSSERRDWLRGEAKRPELCSVREGHGLRRAAPGDEQVE